MSRMRGHSRGRRRLLGSALLALLPGLPLGRLLEAESVDGPSWIGALVGDRHAATVLGKRYLNAMPEERSAAWLARELLGMELPDTITAEQAGSLRRHLCAARTEDYRDGRLVVLDGWVLARTEARLLALIALSASA